MQNHIEQRTVNLESAFRSSGVVDETHFAEPVHEKTYPRTSRSHHGSQSFLADLRDDSFRNPFFAEVSEQDKNAGQSLLAGIK